MQAPPFVNTTIDLSTIPEAGTIELNSIEPDYRKVLRTEWRITAVSVFAIAAALIFFFSEVRTSLWFWIPFAVVIGLLILYYFSNEKGFTYRKYAVREHDVIVERGWIIRTVKVSPFSRIQNCTINSGPLERKWGLATLSLYTAGSDSADLRMHGLKLSDAEKLRTFILSRINGNIID